MRLVQVFWLFTIQLVLAVAPIVAGGITSHPIQRDLLFEPQEIGDHGPSAFVVHDRTYSLCLSKTGAQLVSDEGGKRVSVSMRLVNGASSVTPKGSELSSASINYFVGPESAWQRNVKGYSKVRYYSIYKGVDLVFYGYQRQLEHDFIVSPGSNPAAIQVEWKGAQKLVLNDRGDLLISTATGQMQWTRPVVYQNVHGNRKEIEGRYKLLSGRRVGFDIGEYDRRFELIIDPTLVFSTFVGGSGTEFSRGIAVDSTGNAYVTGHSSSMNLPVTKGAYQTGFGGNTADIVTGDVFVAKYSPSGSLLFLTYLGGQRDDIGMAIALDTSGSVYVTGYTNSGDFPVTRGVLQTAFAGYTGGSFIISSGDVFVSKLSGDGQTLLYSTYLGGSSDDTGFGIAVDSSGDAYITGMTQSADFPISMGAYQTKFAGYGQQSYYPAFGTPVVGGDAFVTKLNPTASAILYSTYVGGSLDDVATAIAIDGSGNAFIGGYTLSFNFPTTAGAVQVGFHGRDGKNEFFNLGDGFLAKLNATGTSLVFSTYLGGSGDDSVTGLTVDSSGNVYASGATTSTNFPVTPGAWQPTYAGPITIPFFVDQVFGDAFVLKLSATGSLLYSTYFGGSGDDFGMSIAADGAGDLIIVGFSDSANLPVTSNAVQATLHGPGPSTTDVIMGDAFLAEFSPSGTLLFGTFLGGTSNDAGLSVAVSASGTAYVAGVTISPDFPLLKAAQPAYGGPLPTHASGGDGFVAAISGFAVAGTPSITAVVNDTGALPVIGQNTWIEIFGTNLAPDMRQWGGSDFVNGQLPTQLDGVNVTVNGKPAFVYYISSTQVDVLTPLDSTTGNVQVVLTNSNLASAPFMVQEQAYAPGFFQFGASPYVAAIHANGSYIGPTTLYPGYTTPAKPGEVIILYANGFGQTNPAIVNGSQNQFGTLPSLPSIAVGGVPATVQFAGVVTPGEYQFNIVVPGGLPNGDNSITATYDNFTTQSGALLTIQQ